MIFAMAMVAISIASCCGQSEKSECTADTTVVSDSVVSDSIVSDSVVSDSVVVDSVAE